MLCSSRLTTKSEGYPPSQKGTKGGTDGKKATVQTVWARLPCAALGRGMTDVEDKKRRLFEHLRRNVSDARVLDAMSRVPRDMFVPEDRRHLAYEDIPLPIGGDQTISQPLIVAMMVAALALDPADKVLRWVRDQAIRHVYCPCWRGRWLPWSGCLTWLTPRVSGWILWDVTMWRCVRRETYWAALKKLRLKP